jgi:hypothetical protein
MRQTYWVTKVAEMASRLTPLEACKESVGAILAMSKVYLKDTINYTSDSEYDPQWEFSLSASEVVLKGHFLVSGGKLYRVRESRTNEGGFLLAVADQLDDSARVTATLTVGGEFDPVTETSVGTVTSTFGILLEPTKLFRFKTEADARFIAGDMSMVIAMVAPVGSVVEIDLVKWKVLTCTPELDAWNLHIRRA